MGRTFVILRKELAEILSNKVLLASLGALPAVMVAMTLFVLSTYVAGADDAGVQAVARTRPALRSGQWPPR
jgi:ABC-type Na+ efflux pump permease subunit